MVMCPTNYDDFEKMELVKRDKDKPICEVRKYSPREFILHALGEKSYLESELHIIGQDARIYFDGHSRIEEADGRKALQELVDEETIEIRYDRYGRRVFGLAKSKS